jgi:transcription elongation factor GreA
MQPVYLTEEGKKQLEEKLNYYRTVLRPEVTKKIGIAREFGDLSENAEYDSAKEEQGKIEAEIAEMEAKIKTCIIIDKNQLDTSKVNMGCTVKVYDLDFDEEVEYTIIGSTESDPSKGLISNESPVGCALLGKKVGDTVIVKTPVGECTLKILAINA